MSQQEFYADLHNHLGMWKYATDLDRVLSKSSTSFGWRGALGVANWSSFRDEDRFGALVNRGSDVYKLEDIDGRAVLAWRRRHKVEETFVFRADEVETDIGHFLYVGTKLGEIVLSGPKVEWKRSADIARNQGAVILLDHPFHHWGAGNHFIENPADLQYVDGIEVFNGNAEFNLPFLYNGANERAREFFVEQYGLGQTHLGGLVSQDGHKIGEIGLNATFMLGGLDPNDLMGSLRKGIASCTPERLSKHRYNWFLGAVNGFRHGVESIIEIAGTKLSDFGLCEDPKHWGK